MAYRKLGVDTKHRRSILANLTKDVIMNGNVVTTETRAKEARKFIEKMITHAKNGSLVSRRKALAFVNNDKAVVDKLFNELAPKYANRNGGYTRIVKLDERRGDDALMAILSLIED
jgi:ribosomal protein L17